MKLGILTYHKAHNYGAMLQAYALCNVLNDQFGNAFFIDYFPYYHKNVYGRQITRKPWKNCSLRAKITYPYYFFAKYLPLYLKEITRMQAFDFFADKYLICKDINQSFDCVVYGSDQIWCKQREVGCPGFDNIYFGYNDFNTVRNITYAASMGVIDLGKEDIAFIKKAMSHFSSISVRETELQRLLNDVCGVSAILTIDPVLLLTAHRWDCIIPTKQLVRYDYLLCYNILEDPEVDMLAEKKAKELDLRVVYIVRRIQYRNYEDNYFVAAGPLEFLWLIKNAKFVISSSFHGVAFSVLYKKQFIARLFCNSSRVQTLLDSLNLSSRLISTISELPFEDINYDLVTIDLEKMRKQSLDYLINAIQ